MQQACVCAARMFQVIFLLRNQFECIVAATADVQACKTDHKTLLKSNKAAGMQS